MFFFKLECLTYWIYLVFILTVWYEGLRGYVGQVSDKLIFITGNTFMKIYFLNVKTEEGLL